MRRVFRIDDIDETGKIVARKFVVATSPENARIEAGPMPTLTRKTFDTSKAGMYQECKD